MNQNTLTKKRILFFTTSLERTGSEIAFFNFLYFSELEKRYDISVMTLSNGYMLERLKEDYKVFVYEKFYQEQNSVVNKIRYKIEKPKNYKTLFAKQVFKEINPDLVYLNGFNISNKFLLEYLDQIAFSKSNVYLYSHEMSVALTSADTYYIENVRSTVGNFYACSNSSAEMIESIFSTQVKVIYPGINSIQIDQYKENGPSIRKTLGIDENRSIWAMVGYCDQNKDPVFFVKLFEELSKGNLPVYFLWIGAQSDSGFVTYCQGLINSKGWDNIKFLGNFPPEEYYPIMNSIDGFVLTSNVDSFPTVVLEAAYLGKCIVSHNSGGVKEFLNENGYDTVSCKSVDSYADGIQKSITNPQRTYDTSPYTMPQAASSWASALIEDIEK